ncbi:MAG: phosphatase PAP2 family protein [Actinobacteria bacterium]|nr:phosphatase PAP2 family protein [Actinomycetota bacterium]MCA1721605.1 phosphatase PAP2 family protein [Actinomycetota bacterium]
MATATVIDAAQTRDSPWRSATPEQRTRRTRLLLLVGVLFVGVAAVFGFPTGREVITGWVLLFLYAACAGQVGVWWRVVVRDWLPLIGVLFLYDFLRGSAEHVGARLADLPTLQADRLNPAFTAKAHVTEMIRFDDWLFGGHVPTVWLQQHFYDPGVVHWYDAVAVPVYFSHFVVSLGVAIVLWALSYQVYRRYVWTLVTLTVITLATYALFPAAPPWMAGLNGALPDVARVASETLQAMGGHTVNSAVERGAAYSNRVAAMPSLHAGVPAMLLAFFWPSVRPLARLGLALYAVAMAASLVYGGEHYVADVLAGWLYAVATVLAVRWWFSRSNAESPSPEGEGLSIGAR